MLEPRKVRQVRSGQDKVEPARNDPVLFPENAILALATSACQMRYAN
jgi:hypothetical protein